MSEQKTYVIIVKETHKKDVYEEDPDSDYGHEWHFLEGTVKIDFVEAVGIDAMRKKVEEIAEANADNPPYDEYDVMTVFEKDSKMILPKCYVYQQGSDDE